MLALSQNDKAFQPEKFLTPSNKRPHASLLFDGECLDSENIDPQLMTSKKSKSSDGSSVKTSKPLFNLTIDNNLSSKVSSGTPLLSTLPSGPASAPAGRSPKHKRIGILSRKRTSLSPFKRIEPPSFGSVSGGVPFSLDAALSGSISGYKAPVPLKSSRSKPSSLDEPNPKSWFFDIHEDTPEEEATNIMEHSTCILDLSSDDEAGPSRKDHRGKENIPPPDHPTDGQAANMNERPVPATRARRTVHVDAMIDVDEPRSPLGFLPAEDFYAKGLDATSIEIIASEADDKDEGPTADDADDESEPSEIVIHTDVDASPAAETASTGESST